MCYTQRQINGDDDDDGDTSSNNSTDIKFYRYFVIHWVSVLNGLVSTNETITLKKHNNAFQFSEHVSMFQTSSSAIMNI